MMDEGSARVLWKLLEEENNLVDRSKKKKKIKGDGNGFFGFLSNPSSYA